MSASDPELERAVLLRGIVDPDWFMEANLGEPLFAAPAHKAVLRALAGVLSDGSVADRVTLRAALGEAASGLPGEALDSIMAGTFSDADTPVAKLRQLAECRRLQQAYMGGAASAASGNLEQARQAVAELLAEPSATRGRVVYGGADQARVIRDHLESPEQMGVHAGCPVVSDLAGDLYPGHELVIGADTNVGKSSIALAMVEGLAKRAVPTVTISLEDSALLFACRRVGIRAGVSSRAILRRRYLPEERNLLDDALSDVETTDLVRFVHLPGGTVGDVTMEMTKAVRAGARLAVVDYLQAIESTAREQDRRNEVRRINTALKTAAHNLGIPLVACSQLKRPISAAASRPTKHDLKEAGDIENAAETVLLAWREEENDAAPVKIWCAKGKIGGVGVEAVYERDTASGALRRQPEGARVVPLRRANNIDNERRYWDD